MLTGCVSLPFSDWEHVVVWAQYGASTPSYVAVSAHGDYASKKKWSDVPKDGGRAKVVYHIDGGSTHAFRFAKSDENDAENHLNTWFTWLASEKLMDVSPTASLQAPVANRNQFRGGRWDEKAYRLESDDA